jgi:hypothetical protein
MSWSMVFGMGLGEKRREKQIPHPQRPRVRNDTKEKGQGKRKEEKQIPHLPKTSRFGMTL